MYVRNDKNDSRLTGMARLNPDLQCKDTLEDILLWPCVSHHSGLVFWNYFCLHSRVLDGIHVFQLSRWMVGNLE